MFEAWAKQKKERPAFHPDPVYLPNLIANLEQKLWPKLFKSFSMVIKAWTAENFAFFDSAVDVHEH